MGAGGWRRHPPKSHSLCLFSVLAAFVALATFVTFAALVVLAAFAFLSTFFLALSAVLHATSTLFLAAFFLSASRVSAVGAIGSCTGAVAYALMLMLNTFNRGCRSRVNGLFCSGVVVAGNHTESKGCGDESR